MYQLNAQCLFFTYIYCISPICFGVKCTTIIRQNNHDIYLQPGVVIELIPIQEQHIPVLNPLYMLVQDTDGYKADDIYKTGSQTQPYQYSTGSDIANLT
jgi:hypothetical protein